MRTVPGWALASAAGAPVLLIGGWTLAGALQPAGYRATTDTISALAAHGATDRWLMTGALAGLGGCHLITALGLRPAARSGRLALAAGGAATLLVAAFPQPAHGSSDAHVAAATSAFFALALWPAFARVPEHPAPAQNPPAHTPPVDTLPDPGPPEPEAVWALRPAASAAATVALLGAVGWFGWELHSGTRIGLAERVAAGSQALWPLIVTAAARRRGRAHS
jgi:hypothetical protein